jgi:hypothetical protein
VSLQYAQPVTKKGAKAAAAAAAAAASDAPAEEKKFSNHVKRKVDERKKEAKIDTLLESQFGAGRLYACISSRPGQSGRADGYILEGQELEVGSRLPSLRMIADSVTAVLPQAYSCRKAEARMSTRSRSLRARRRWVAGYRACRRSPKLSR